jgi:hypothetical protein
VCFLPEAGLTESHLTDEYTCWMADEIPAAIRLLVAEGNRIDTTLPALEGVEGIDNRVNSERVLEGGKTPSGH